MKKFLNILLQVVFFSAALVSCKKDEQKVFFEGGTAPVLQGTANSGGSVVNMSFTTPNAQAFSLSWTNPEYKFTTGVSSQDVSYIIEIDTAASFTNPQRASVVVARDLGYSVTQSKLNDLMLNTMGLPPSVPHNLKIRVKSYLGNNGAGQLISNVISFTATPYTIPPKVKPPAAGTLYITGSASPANWMGGGDPEVVAQKFTRVSNTIYELTVNLNGGGSYLFVPRYGNWSAVSPDPEKYGFIGSNNENNVNGDDFKAFGGDMKAPAASGNYKIVVDFQRGKFTVTPI